MKLTIRSRLTLWYTFAFFSVLILILAVLLWELQHQLGNEARKTLQIEENWLSTFIASEFLPLRTLAGEEYADLAGTLREELNERYGLKQQFVVLIIASRGEKRKFVGGVKGAEAFLPGDFFARRAGTYHVVVAERRYQVRLFRRDWGTAAVGVENETLWRVAEETGEILIWLMPLSALFAIAGGWLMAKLALRPVVSAAQAAEAISMENLNERLPAYAGTDEFGMLVATLNRMIERLAEGVARLQRFTQDAAHELRTPLTILRGDLELAYQDEKTPEETRVWVQKNLDRVITLGQIVDNLLLLARSDAGNYPVNKALFRLEVILQEIFEDLQILAETRAVAVHLEKNEPLEFYGDELLIRRLLLNLCDNALKYTAQGHITLSLRRVGDVIEFIIRDTGMGIPANDLPHIFDRFYRVDKSHASATGGSGLGLAICKWIVEAHNGALAVTSEEMQGTTVRVTLPANYP